MEGDVGERVRWEKYMRGKRGNRAEGDKEAGVQEKK